MIQIEYFIIESQGDPSVGIFPARWELSNTMYFESEEDVIEFKKHIHNAFEYVSDTNVRILDSRDFDRISKLYENN